MNKGRTAAGGVALGALALCGWFEAAMRPFGLASSVVTLSAAGAVGLAGSTARRSRRDPAAGGPTGPAPDTSRRLGGVVAWVLATGFALAVELWELFHSPRNLYPTLSSLANEVIGPGHRVGRALAFVCWGAVGLAMAASPRTRP